MTANNITFPMDRRNAQKIPYTSWDDLPDVDHSFEFDNQLATILGLPLPWYTP